MNLNFQENIPANFADSSRVWIYQSSRVFLNQETSEIENLLQQFISSWKSHADDVKGYGHLFFNRFIILMADESLTGVGGCSTDSSIHFIKLIEQKFNVQLLERQNLAFLINEKIEIIPLNEIDQAVEKNIINADTIYFNNTVLTKKELLESWIVPVKKSWLGKRVNLSFKL